MPAGNKIIKWIEIKEFLERIREYSKEQVECTNHTFFRLSEKQRKITHNIVIASERGFNHKIERLHNSIRERTKIFRGFGALESARMIMKGYEIYYNFCRKHQALNKYPYELATDLELGKNKWLDLIRLSISS